jgi:putative ABC transport system substrate-binding protein
MRRREFVAGLVGATAMPFSARAQQGVPVVGYVRSTTATGFAHIESALRQGLKEAGFVEGQNVAVEFHYADDRADRLSALIANLIRRPVNVIVGNSATALAAKAATKTVPVVFVTGTEPVRDGLVASLNRPRSCWC